MMMLFAFISASALSVAPAEAGPIPFELSEAEWKARCPAVFTTGELKARGLKLHAIYQAPPQYPHTALSVGRTGTVALSTRIDIEGNVVDVELTSAGHPYFVAGALDAAKQWRFEKVTVEGNPACVVASFMLKYDIPE